MKNLSSIFMISLVAMALCSCQDVIDIELRDADRKYVIEGSVVQGVDSAVVRVSRTTSYFDTSGPEAITDAEVELTLPDGTVRVLEHVSEGYYKVMGITPSTNATYSLKVRVDDEIFTAAAYMPESVSIDSLTFKPVLNFFGPPPQGPPKFRAFLNFQDPIARNYYRAVFEGASDSGDKLDEIQVFDDELTNGNYIEIPVFNREYELGDTANVALQTMDADVYKFFDTFESAASADAGSPFSAAPDNPISNIQGGAIGVFAAYSRSEASYVVVE